MDKLINDICEKTGLDRANAEKVAGYLKDNVTRIPAMLQGGDGSKGIGDVASKIGGAFAGKRS